MSKVPARKVLLPPDTEVATFGHDDLVRWVWRTMDGFVTEHYRRGPDWLDQVACAVRVNVENFFCECEKQFERIAGEQRSALRREIDAAKVRVGDVSALCVSPQASLPKISSRTVQAELTMTRTDRSGSAHGDVVGFMDLSCDVEVPESVFWEAMPELPFLVFEFDDERNDESARTDDYIRALREGFHPDEMARWRVAPRKKTAWFDVRATLPPLGQLLRELKTLRSFIDDHDDLVVVVESASDEIVAVLAAEGFLVLQRTNVPQDVPATALRTAEGCCA